MSLHNFPFQKFVSHFDLSEWQLTKIYYVNSNSKIYTLLSYWKSVNIADIFLFVFFFD